MLISSECYHLYVSISVLCVHVVCIYIHIVDKYCSCKCDVHVCCIYIHNVM